MLKKIFISILIALVALSAVFNTVPTFAQNADVIGFTDCNLIDASKDKNADKKSLVSKCTTQILTFLFVIGIFLLAFRVAYIGINKFNPLEQGGEAKQVGLVRDTIIGLILLGAPSLILGALNTNLLKIDILDFSNFTGGIAALKPATIDTNVAKIGVTTITSGGIVKTGVIATAKGNVENGKLVSIDIDNGGTSYKSAPKVTITGGVVAPPGKNAIGVASILGGVVTSVRIVDPGQGYTSEPTIELSGGNELAGSASKEKTVLGITPSFLEASFEASRYSGRDNNSGDVIKFLRAQKNCEYRVFSFVNITDADCDNFIPFVAPEFQKVLDKYSNEVDYIKRNGSKTIGSYEGFFTNTEAIFVKWTGESPEIKTGFTTGSFDEKAGETICVTNFFSVTIPDYPTKKISTRECGKDNLIKDTANLTSYGTYSYGCGVFSSCTGERRLPTIKAQEGITFPIGFNFNRQITIFDENI
jgi:hypothetical protein